MLNIRYREKTNAWPGFVDLFSNLVIILIFLLIVFVFLWTTTNVFNKNTNAKKMAELEQTTQAQAEEIVQMTEDTVTATELLVRARDALETQEQEKAVLADTFEQQKEDIANAYEQKLAELTTQKNDIAKQYENQIAELQSKLQQAISDKDKLVEKETEQSELNNQLVAEKNDLNNRISELTSQLNKAEELAKQQDVEYVEMSNRLNKALADKIAELNTMAQYQSEFYKQVKNALGDRTVIKQDGDRFIVSSDILFPSGSYKISQNGKSQLRILANIIKDFEEKIPTDIDWIIRVDGHTDNKDVVRGTRGYTNNMQLSLLRATAVTNELVKNGVSKRRLVPSGFGEMHPIALGNDAASLQKNRRIELQLTNK